jgi:hypothetical protein
LFKQIFLKLESKISVPDLGSGAFLTPGSGMNISDHISESLEKIFWDKILKFFDADLGSGIFLTLVPGWKKFGSRDPG